MRNLCAGVVGMAGYGTYALVSGQRAQQEMESESAEAETAPSAQLTLNDKPESTQTDEAVNLSGGELTINNVLVGYNIAVFTQNNAGALALFSAENAL